MGWLSWLIVIALVIWFVWDKAKGTNNQEPKVDEKKDYSESFKQKWLFSYNEKDVSNKLQPIAQRHQLYFAANFRIISYPKGK